MRGFWLLLLVIAAGCCCWLLLLVAAAGCCCWLLLLVAAAGCCCWLLLLVVASGCFCWLLLLVAAAGCCCWLLLLLAVAGCCCWLLLLVAVGCGVKTAVVWLLILENFFATSRRNRNLVFSVMIEEFSKSLKVKTLKSLAKIYFGTVTLERREILIIGNLPKGWKAGVEDVDCSVDRV